MEKKKKKLSVLNVLFFPFRQFRIPFFLWNCYKSLKLFALACRTLFKSGVLKRICPV